MVQGRRFKAIKGLVLLVVSIIMSCESKTSQEAVVHQEGSSFYFKKGEMLPFLDVSVYGEDTVINEIGSFVFRDWNGKKWTNDSLKGKPYIADFFFTSCPTICPGMTNAMKRVQSELDGTRYNIVSFTIDPKHDDSAKLKAYVDHYAIDTMNWSFLRSSNSNYAIDIAMNGFKQVAQTSNDETSGGFDHSANFILIDKNGFLRGVYDSQSDEELNKLINDVRILF